MKYLTNHPTNSEGMPLELFAGMPWEAYLQAMARNGTYGDQITLQAAADLYNIEIVVVSTLGPDATVMISPSSSIPTKSSAGALCREPRGTLHMRGRQSFVF